MVPAAFGPRPEAGHPLGNSFPSPWRGDGHHDARGGAPTPQSPIPVPGCGARGSLSFSGPGRSPQSAPSAAGRVLLPQLSGCRVPGRPW